MSDLETALDKYYERFEENYPLGISDARTEDEMIADIELCVDTGHKAVGFPYEDDIDY